MDETFARQDDDTPRRGTGRWHESRFRALLEKDPARFAEAARRCFDEDASLAERMGALQVAVDASRGAGDELFALALDIRRTRDQALLEGATRLLVRRIERDAAAWERLRTFVVIEPGVEPSLRRWIAAAVAAHAPEDEARRLVRDLERDGDRSVWLEVVRALARNPAPSVREIAAELERSRWWDDEICSAARGEESAPVEEANVVGVE